jgi:hypothetical protein
LLTGLRPLLFPTRLDEPMEKVGFQDEHYLTVAGGRPVIDVTDHAIYLAMTIRNVGTGMAVLDRWCLRGNEHAQDASPAPLDQFRRLTRDLYIPPNDRSFWQGALRDPAEPAFELVRTAVERGSEPILLELLYGDFEGGQRTISRFAFRPIDGGYLTALSRHWYLDTAGPR